MKFQVSCEPDKEKSEASARVFEASDITAAITSLTSNYFLVKAFIIYWLHVREPPHLLLP